MNWLKLIEKIILPLALGGVGWYYTNTTKAIENEAKYVELAVGILSEQPTKENQEMRRWAIEIINEYSGIKMSDSTKESFLDSELKLIRWSEVFNPNPGETGETRNHLNPDPGSK